MKRKKHFTIPATAVVTGPPPDQPVPVADKPADPDPPSRKPKGPIIGIGNFLVMETIDLIRKQPSEPIMRGIVRKATGMSIPQELMGDPEKIIRFLEEEWTYRQESKPTMPEYVELEVTGMIRQIFTTTRTRTVRARFTVELHNKYIKHAIASKDMSPFRNAIYDNFPDLLCGAPTFTEKKRKSRPYESERMELIALDSDGETLKQLTELYGKAI